MTKSMTGFGRGNANSDGISVTVEIRSVNSRYLDMSFRLPQSVQDKELNLKELVQERVTRGKLNVTVHLDQAETGEPGITFNRKLVLGYKKLLNDLRAAADIKEPVTLRNLIYFNDIFESRKQDEKTLEVIWNLICDATSEALDQLVQMRNQEGRQLADDLKERIQNIEEKLDHIAELTSGRAQETKEKLQERLKQLVSDDSLDPDRLETEVALLADKMDITEEIVRLRSHLKYFLEALDSDTSKGRRLNFLSQEINREINTIGSKANSSDISHYVVEVKENLEQIREQIQNVE